MSKQGQVFFVILIKFYVRHIQYHVEGFLGRGVDLLLLSVFAFKNVWIAQKLEKR